MWNEMSYNNFNKGSEESEKEVWEMKLSNKAEIIEIVKKLIKKN